MNKCMCLFSRINSNKISRADSIASDSSSLTSGSPRSSSPIIGWTIKYKTIPKKVDSQGVWGGYQTREEFVAMHLR
jgi:hypothetical protein